MKTIDQQDRLLARALVAVYPPAWRRRYAAEMLALLADQGLSARAAMSLVVGAASAWIRPGRHLFDPAARMRTSLSVMLAGWVVLAAGGLVFGQLNEGQALGPATPGHPVTAITYALFAYAAHASVAIVAVAVAPLALRLVAQAGRRRRYQDLMQLTLPVTAPIGFLVVLITTAHLVRRGHGIGPNWFLLFTVLGLGAGILVAAGPSAVLHRREPDGPLLRLATAGTAVAVVAMAIAALASIANGTSIEVWANSAWTLRPAPGVLVGYGLVMALAATTALSSGARGTRAALSGRFRDVPVRRPWPADRPRP